MSTKIYDAYRIPRSEDIIPKLLECRGFICNKVANDVDFLRSIHRVGYVLAKRELLEGENYHAGSYIKACENGDLNTWWLSQCFNKADQSDRLDAMDVKTSCSVLMDDEYWYVKFFLNYPWQYRGLDKELFRLGFEDYHYQNQVDPPEDITYTEYEFRRAKWDELLKPDFTFKNSLKFDVFNGDIFIDLISRYYYQGKKSNEELYEHLAYKFDKISG